MLDVLIELLVKVFPTLVVLLDLQLRVLQVLTIHTNQLLLLKRLQHQVLVQTHAVQAFEQRERLRLTARILVLGHSLGQDYWLRFVVS